MPCAAPELNQFQLFVSPRQNKKTYFRKSFYLAEEEGFEPSDPCRSPVFKTGALDHYATLPYLIVPYPSNNILRGRPKRRSATEDGGGGEIRTLAGDCSPLTI